MSLIERYVDKIRGVISCYDRIVIQGILPGFCFAEGMTSYLYAHQIRIFDYPRFAEPLRDAIRANAERLAQENGFDKNFLFVGGSIGITGGTEKPDNLLTTGMIYGRWVGGRAPVHEIPASFPGEGRDAGRGFCPAEAVRDYRFRFSGRRERTAAPACHISVLFIVSSSALSFSR